MCVCACVCGQFRAFRQKRFVRSLSPGGRIWPQGEGGAPGSCCSLLLGCVARVWLIAGGHQGESLRQGALTRLDPRIQLQNTDKKSKKEVLNIKSDIVIKPF